MTEFPVAGIPAGTVVVRAAGLRVHGMTVVAGGRVPSAGELAGFCRLGVTARRGAAGAGRWWGGPGCRARGGGGGGGGPSAAGGVRGSAGARGAAGRAGGA